MQTDPARVRRTDPGDPDKCPVWDLHKVYSNADTQAWVQQGCRTAGIGCLDCKAPLIEQDRRGSRRRSRKRAQEFEENPELVRGIIAEGCERARGRGARDAGCGTSGHGDELSMKPELTLVQNCARRAAPAPRAAPAQGEMPFAVVEGQPITEMPRDLYIPPQALEVFLEAFEGPLDMLLYLIRRQNLDILDIPIAEITRQYMRYIELMQVLQLELAGEYLLMAATLAEVKSRMLLPRSAQR